MHQNISSADATPQPTPTTWTNHDQQKILVLHVHKATTLDPSNPPPKLVLIADQEVQSEILPPNFFNREAQAIFDAITATLPQGTIDRLFALLSQRAASKLAVQSVDLQQFKW